MAALANCVKAIAGGVRIAVKAQPRASREGVVGVVDDGRGGAALKVAVAAPPVEGAANEAIARVLARALGVAPSQVTLARGASGRHKTFEVRGVALADALARLAT